MKSKITVKDIRLCKYCGLPITGYKPRKGETQVHKNINDCFYALRCEIAARDKIIEGLISGKIGPGDPEVFRVISRQVARLVQIIEAIENILENTKTELLENQERILS